MLWCGYRDSMNSRNAFENLGGELAASAFEKLPNGCVIQAAGGVAFAVAVLEEGSGLLHSLSHVAAASEGEICSGHARLVSRGFRGS